MITQIITYHILFFFCNAVKPACQSFIIMGSCISYGIFRIIVRQVIVGTTGISGVKGKFQHLHAGEAAVPHQLTDRLAHITKILRNDLPLAQCLLHGAEQLDAGAFLPVALCRSLAAVGDGEILIEPAEVVDAMLFSAERKRGYQMSLLKHGITPREEDCVEIDALNDAYEETLKALFTAPDRPTAMLVSDDILAVVLEQFCGKLGLRVPKDLSIVSFNNSLFSRITSPQLTTVDVNPYQLGMEAASQTINHIENPNLLAIKIIVPHKLIQRESCCPPPEV